MSRTYSKELLEDYRAKDYEYNGMRMTEYEALQEQRKLERNIRRWKREQNAMKAAGLNSGEASAKVTEWNRIQKDFLEQTGLKADGTRTVVGKGGLRKEAERVALKKQKEIEKYSQYRYNKDGTIVVTDDWTEKKNHKINKTYKPFAIIDTISRDNQRDRAIYDKDGRLVKQIHGGDHKQPKWHPEGEHGHDITWDGDKPIFGKHRPWTAQEKIEHKDLLKG